MLDTPVMDRLVARTVRLHRPLNVHFDLTYRCNERCIHCYLDHEDYGEMSAAEVRGILDQLAAVGTLFLTFSGGEIFLRRDLFELLAHARQLHFDISLKTNALLVTPERSRRLRELGIRRVQISLYSAEPAVHDAITKVPGSLARSLEGIRLLKETGFQVKIACPLMKQNLPAYRGVMDLAAELGVPYILDLTITPMMNGDARTLALRSSAQELLPILQDSRLRPLKTLGQEACPPDDGSLASATSSGIEGGADDDIPCSAGHNSCYISPYGDVYPCVQMPLSAGNLRREPFEAIWYHATEMRRVRAIRESQLELCSGCAIHQFCERCPGLAMMEGGNLLGAYDRACELAELKARLAGFPQPISALHASRLEQKQSLLPSHPGMVESLSQGS